MARRLIQTIIGPAMGVLSLRTEARLYRDAEWNEYRVTFYAVGLDNVAIKREGADYHTDNLQDAIATANHVLGNRADK